MELQVYHLPHLDESDDITFADNLSGDRRNLKSDDDTGKL